jgi:Protein kinase C terminal domain.
LNGFKRKRAKPPFKPKIRKPNDTRNFDAIFTQEAISESFDPDLISPSPNQFSGFTYRESQAVSIDGQAS